jgi:arginine-tRNA-protein transferase
MIRKPVQLSCAFPGLPAPVDVPLVNLPEHACPYLPGRVAEDRAIWAGTMPAGLYEQFMDAGFRRSGRLIYQPICKGCRACISIRVPVASFKPDKSQRRCRRRNSDLMVTHHPPRFSEEKRQLYENYIREWHGRVEIDSPSSLETFLYDSPLETTVEFEYRQDNGKLLAVGICDACPNSLSSVYFYFDPDHSRRGLGTYGSLCEIDFAASHGLGYYYLGYWVGRCSAMDYKKSFRPNELLQSDGVWRPFNQ